MNMNSGGVFRRFKDDADGGITVLTVTTFLLMFVSAGMAVDFMRHEAFRAELQDALDRGVLAAASATQTIDEELTVREFMRTSNFIPDDVLLDVQQEHTSGRRDVSATAGYTFRTYFLKLVGIPTLNVNVKSAAIEEIDKLEISLVLDISGSMRHDGRIGNLRTASKEFVTDVLGHSASSNFINLVPYAGHVNPGPTLFTALGGVRDHNDSSCIEFDATDFATTSLLTGNHAQVPHFHYWPTAPATMDWGWCPSDNTSIAVANNVASELHLAIDNIRLHDGTGTMNGLKYGLGLLDPASQSLFSTLVTANEVSDEFVGGPVAWHKDKSQKVIVLMTDGKITDQLRPDDANDAENATVHLLDNKPTYKYSTQPDNVQTFSDLCTLAKANGVIVFTIAFEAPADAQTQMENCATSTSHYFEAYGTGLSDAFAAISFTLQKLKLVSS